MSKKEFVGREEDIESIDSELLTILLKDRSTGKNIIWATKDYARFGKGFFSTDSISPNLVRGRYKIIIQPRVYKHKYKQTARTKGKAEVFTPSWVCNKQNNLIDEQWFGRPNAFNVEVDSGWVTNKEKVLFSDSDKTWQDYVCANRLEVSCGEAPYLTSRYDTVSGKYIDVAERIGLVDRKLRVVNENTSHKNDWFEWAEKAYKSIYAYEFHGDSLLLARENLLLTFIDNYAMKFGDDPSVNMLKRIATILSWNIWQMDGFTYTIPLDEVRDEYIQISLFDNEESPKRSRFAKVKDWSDDSVIEFRELIKKGHHHGY